MFNGIDSGPYGTLHALRAVGVDSHRQIVIMGGLHDGRQFPGGELRIVAALCQAEHAAGHCKFDDVRALLVALSHGLARIIRAVEYPQFRPGVAHVFVPQAIGRIGMPASGGQSGAGGEDARTIDVTGLHGAAYRIRDTMFLFTEIAHRGKSSQQRAFGERDRPQRIIGLFHEKIFAVVLGRELVRNMHMQVNQTGQHRVPAQVQQLLAGTRCDEARAHVADAIAIRDDADLLPDFPGLHVHEPASVDDISGRRGRGCCDQQRGRNQPLPKSTLFHHFRP